jgi:uncharacterized integral membrane protein
MIVLGLLLMLACTAVAVDAVVQNSATLSATLFDQHVTGLSLGAIFVAGAVVGLLFTLGLMMMIGGFGRAGRRRRERRAAARDATAETEALRAHNERLESELEARNADTAAYPGEPAAADDRSLTGGRHRADR